MSSAGPTHDSTLPRVASESGDVPRGDEIAAAVVEGSLSGSPTGQATAKQAVKLLKDGHGFIEPTAEQRMHVAMAFAGAKKVVYGRAFDALKVTAGVEVDWSDLSSVRQHLPDITLYEVKSTSKTLPDDFSGYFFSLSTAELLVAQSLGTQFRFAFVSIASGKYLDVSLQDVYKKTKAIYPTWSISF